MLKRSNEQLVNLMNSGKLQDGSSEVFYLFFRCFSSVVA
ncbi:unnamed protein product [Enterobius vermicularis]|uniref:Uncharacterized protein n=1 Tax=Enterobius vermicularis TaxID=51028 RepID=A0A0N4UUV9_ENTVE|nr:unnamed protein product [Enterobius vermicularis]